MANKETGLSRALIVAEQVKCLAKALAGRLEGQAEVDDQVLAHTVVEKAEEMEAIIEEEVIKTDKRRK